jgi:hypothetical protein
MNSCALNLELATENLNSRPTNPYVGTGAISFHVMAGSSQVVVPKTRCARAVEEVRDTDCGAVNAGNAVCWKYFLVPFFFVIR